MRTRRSAGSVRVASGGIRPSPPPRGVRLLIALVIIAGVAAVALYAASSGGFELPDQLRHLPWSESEPALEVTYRAHTFAGEAPDAVTLARAVDVLRDRVDRLGVDGASVETAGDDRIVVTLPGAGAHRRELRVIGATGRVRFFFDDPASRPVGPEATEKAALKAAGKRGVPKDQIALLREAGVSAGYILVQRPKGQSDEQERWYVYRLPPMMNGDAVKHASSSLDDQGEPIVSIDFTKEGGRRFAQVTRELYRLGVAKQESQTFAIVLDRRLISDPMIDYTDEGLKGGITGGYAEISGGDMTAKEAEDIAFFLNAGSLPVTLRLISSLRLNPPS